MSSARVGAALGLLLTLAACVARGPESNGPSSLPGYVAAISTPTAEGTGLLLPGARLVTNAHVVWPHGRVDVRFADGSAGTGLPVVAVDWLADIALVDVSSIDGIPKPGTLSPERPRAGAAVTLAGHDAEGPVTLDGSVTGVRVWNEAGIAFVTTDIPIPDGSSGGALVDASGTIVGIAGLSIDGSAVALAAGDVTARLAATSPARWPTAPIAPTDATETSANLFDEIVYLFEGRAGEDVVLAWDRHPGSVAVTAPDGVLEATEDDLVDGELRLRVEKTGTHFVSVLPTRPGRVAVSASVPLGVLQDPDRDTEIGEGTHEGISDYPGDLDWFLLAVPPDTEVALTVSSANMDPAVAAVPVDDPASLLSDSDSGGGVLGWDAALEFRTTGAETLLVAVFDEGQFGPGSYLLTVDIGP